MSSALQPHQERVVAEKADLDARMAKLYAFIHGEAFFVVVTDEDEQIRLIEQLNAMLRYSEILGARIAAFKP